MTRPSPPESAPPGSDSPLDLAALQQWLFSRIALPPDNGGDDDSPGTSQVEDHIARSQALSSDERLAIYQQAYVARLLEVLRHEFSILHRALGERLFDQFAIEYLRNCPSESYTLAHLGNRFVEFLESTRPGEATSPEESWADFIIDLARLERTVNQVFDGPGSEDLTPLQAGELARLSPEEFEHARLTTNPSLNLIRTRFPINDFFSSLLRDERPSIPEPTTSYTAVSRIHYRTRRHPLSEPQYLLLHALQHGANVGEALEIAVRTSEGDLDAMARQVERWFAEWTAAGYFLRVETGNRSD